MRLAELESEVQSDVLSQLLTSVVPMPIGYVLSMDLIRTNYVTPNGCHVDV